MFEGNSPLMPHWFRSIVLVALLGAPGLARAQAPAPVAPAVAGSPSAVGPALAAQRRKLRAELDRVNAEIDGLKHDNRGLREDYRLRARMADAEALAQRLTELDVRIEHLNPGAGRHPEGPLPTAPEARPSDDRAALEAKADILADQARRLGTQADALAGRVTELRGRQELRRRAGQLERDPFSPLEQSKRRVASGASAAPVPTSKEAGGAPVSGTGPPAPGRGTVDTTSGTGTTSPTGTTGAPAVLTPPAGGTTSSVPAPAGTTQDGARITSSPAVSAAPIALPVGASVAADAPGSVAGQFRGILDAGTLAEIRRLENTGSPGSNLQAMERALSALRARAAQLNSNAATLRAQAKNSP
jgi:hypothetical protein